MSQLDPLAELRETIDTQRDRMQGGLNTASPGAGITQIVEIPGGRLRPGARAPGRDPRAPSEGRL